MSISSLITVFMPKAASITICDAAIDNVRSRELIKNIIKLLDRFPYYKLTKHRDGRCQVIVLNQGISPHIFGVS